MALTRSNIFFIAFLVLLVSVFLAPNTYIHELFSYERFYNYTPRVIDSEHDINYIGLHDRGVEHFQNIFYAEDTSGPNRFAPPIPIQHPPGTLIDATSLGAFCPQGVGGPPLPFQSPITNISENCGNALGSAADQMFQPDGLVQQAKANHQPIIFVAINYRLGVYGYATSKALIDKKHANVGLRDQRVRRNIAAFGGDPENMTAIGQSVGASSIGLHLTSYRGKQGVPFQKAMFVSLPALLLKKHLTRRNQQSMMSGATGTNFNIMSPFMATNTANVARSLDCIPENSSPDSEETLLCLKNKSMEEINKYAISYPEDAKPRIGGP
ncbi:MAG: hypothetical protein Q9216_006169, partial [Gyalolechia sp. 2 TL-2023]